MLTQPVLTLGQSLVLIRINTWQNQVLIQVYKQCVNVETQALRRPCSRAEGEQRLHEDKDAQEDLVCTLSSGGRRGGGDASGLGDARIQKVLKPFKKAQKGIVRLKKESKEPIRLVQESSFQKPIRLVLKPIRID